MAHYRHNGFSVSTQEDIQDMYQALCGEAYLYIDSALTCDEREVKKDAGGILELLTGFFEMLAAWMAVAPQLADYYPYMQKYPNLYLVCPEAAVLGLYESFATTLDLIFGSSPRSEDFMRACSGFLKFEGQTGRVRGKRLHAVRLPLHL